MCIPLREDFMNFFNKYKKAILQGIFVVVVFALTLYGVFKGEDLEKLF